MLMLKTSVLLSLNLAAGGSFYDIQPSPKDVEKEGFR